MYNQPKPLWFKSKKFGWGWTPATWQGWLILAVYIVLIFTSAIFGPVFLFLYFIISTPTLIYICYKTGEKPRWRWGD